MGYIVFDGQNDFDEWHKKVKEFLGIPRLGRNGATGNYSYDACGTFQWTNPMPYRDGKIIGYATPSICFGHKLEPVEIAKLADSQSKCNVL